MPEMMEWSSEVIGYWSEVALATDPCYCCGCCGGGMRAFNCSRWSLAGCVPCLAASFAYSNRLELG